MTIDSVDSTFKVGEVAATTGLPFYHRYEGDMLEEQFHGEGVADMQGGHKYEVRSTHTHTQKMLYVVILKVCSCPQNRRSKYTMYFCNMHTPIIMYM